MLRVVTSNGIIKKYSYEAICPSITKSWDYFKRVVFVKTILRFNKNSKKFYYEFSHFIKTKEKTNFYVLANDFVFQSNVLPLFAFIYLLYLSFPAFMCVSFFAFIYPLYLSFLLLCACLSLSWRIIEKSTDV